jgi:hypothetical protein
LSSEVLGDGYKIDSYVSRQVPAPTGVGVGGALLGSMVCIYTYLQNLDNQSTAPPTLASLYVTNAGSVNTSVSSGLVFFRGGCSAPASSSESFGPNSTGWNCNVVWDTSQPYNGLLPNAAWPDAYLAYETISLTNSKTLIQPTDFRFASSSLGTTASHAYSWFGDSPPPSGCGNTTVMGTSLVQGYRLEVRSPPQVVAQTSAAQGVAVCIYTSLQNLKNASTSLPVNESLTVTNALTPGAVYFQGLCQAPPYSGSFGPNGTTWNCAFYWNTSNAYNYTGSVAYQIGVVASFSNPSTLVNGGSNIIVRGGSFAPTTATTTATTANYECGGPVFRLLPPAQNGSIYLKIVTDQGSVTTNNGTLFVTHTVPASSEASGGKANYCLRLNGNATGYMELAANDGLPQTGSYNLTLFAGYNGGPGYQGTIPSLTVQPDTTVYVTLSVPSGEVTVVSCAQGNSCTTTTTTSTPSSGG